MAESTLALTRTEIKQVLGVQAGWGDDSSNWSTNETSQIDRSIKRGLRMAYFNPEGYKWNFLEPVGTLTIFATVTGTTSGNSDTTVTATANKFLPSMIGQSITFDTSGNDYTITGYTSATEITIGSDATAETDDDTFTITPDYSYRLPDDFNFMLDRFTHPSTDTAWYRGIEEVNEAQIRRYRERSNQTGPPELFAIRPVSADGSTGQRKEAIFWPDIDQEYSLLYRYSVLPNALVDSTNEYPLGGAQHSEMILAACRAALDLDLSDRRGDHYEEFLVQLRASINQDRLLAPKTLGNMGPGSGRSREGFCRHDGVATFTVNGETLLR